MHLSRRAPLVVCLNRLLPVAAATAICDHYNNNADVRALWRKQKATWAELSTPDMLNGRTVYVIGIPHVFREDGSDQHIIDFLSNVKKHANETVLLYSDQPYLDNIEKDWGFVSHPTPGWILLKEYQNSYIAYLRNVRGASKGLPPHVAFIHDNPALMGLLSHSLSVRNTRCFLRANALGIENYAYRGSIANQYRKNATLIG